MNLSYRLPSVVAWIVVVCAWLYAPALAAFHPLDTTLKKSYAVFQYGAPLTNVCLRELSRPPLSGHCVSFSIDSLLRKTFDISRHRQKRRDDSVLAVRFMDSGEIRFRRGDFRDAEQSFTDAVMRYRGIAEGTPCVDLARGLAGLGRCFSELGKYAEADSVLEEALAMYRRLYWRVARAEFASALRAAARASFDRGDYNKARIRYTSVLAMRRRLFNGQDSPELAQSLLELGIFNYKRGVYARSRGLLEDALTIYRAIYPGIDHPDLLRCRIALASYYQGRGRPDKAARQLDTALPMLDRLRNGDLTQHLASSMIDVSLLLLARGDTVGARARLLAVVDNFRHNYDGDLHFDLARSVSLLVGLAVQGDDLAAAKSWLDEATHMYARLCDERDHPDRAGLECARAAYFARSHRWKQADLAFESASAMYHRMFKRTGQLELALGIQRIGELARRYGMNQRAEIAYHDLLEILPRVTRESSAFEGEEEQIRFRQHLSEITDTLAHFFLDRGETTQLLELSLWTKGRVLAAVEWRNRVLAELRLSDQGIDTALDRYSVLRQGMYRIIPEPDSASNLLVGNLDCLEAKREEISARAEHIEDFLVARSAEVKTGRHEITWKGVARQLHGRQCAIEFTRIANGDVADSATYYALVLRRGGKLPVLVRLCNEGDLAKLLSHPVISHRQDNSSYIHASNCGTRLYQLVWAPLEPLLSKQQLLYLSPDGLLNRVAFGALQMESSPLLQQRYDLRYLFNVRDLVPGPAVPASPRPRELTAIVIGGVRYSCDSAALCRANARTLSGLRHSSPSRATSSASSVLPRDVGTRTPLLQLDGSRGEADSVAEFLRIHSYRITKYVDTDATEEAFMRLQSPRVLHIATHGFFFHDSLLPRDQLNRMRFKGGIDMVQYAENPLVRSGILLAGANRVWTGNRPLKGLDDGIVTAYDVATMNLSGTDLVVLSACETGLGDIKVGEGVFGLKRAFRAAGARAVMMSLWKVPDAETRELMQLFYKYWLVDRLQKGIALNNAQRDMAKKYDDPYYWAAFVLVGE